VYKADTYLFVEDTATQVRIFVPKATFLDERQWRRIRLQDSVTFDVEFTEQGPKAVRGSVNAEF
jgi:hypothetical protein